MLGLLAVLACVLAAATVAATRSATAAPTSVRPGLGRSSGGEFVGFYVTRDGTKVYCLSPRKRTPSTVSLRPAARYPGLSRMAGDALGYAIATWGDARSRDAAAVTSQVLNALAGNGADVARRNRHLPRALRSLVTRRVAQARLHHGPYVLRVMTTSAPLPGGSATGTVRLQSTVGQPVAGVGVSLRATGNARVPTAVRTDRHGLATFRYSVTDVGEVRITAAASGLPGTALRLTTPRAGEQRLVAAAGRVAVRADRAFRGDVGGFAHGYACTSDCAGRPMLHLSACAPPSRTASRIVYRVAGRPVVSVFPASGHRRCLNAATTAADRSTVTASWQFATARGWSSPVPARGGFVVDCPAVPAVTVTMVYDCSHASVGFGLGRPGTANAGVRRAVLVVGGARTARVYAPPGRSVSWSVAVPCGARQKLTVRSGVQRADGGWNYGRSATVVTP